jgi:hypothetical protein
MGLLNHLGRPANEVVYEEFEYNSRKYIVGNVVSKGETYKFIIDGEDYEEVSKYSWHITSNNYISTTLIHDKKRKCLYLHNFIMNRDAFKGKGQVETIDHINQNGLDNRKENLRLISQSEQNINQTKKKRSVVLPEGCKLNPDDIPKHIWYVRANGLHGDRFAIEFKTEGVVWKTTSSKKVTIEDKLIEAKEKLKELYEIYPYLDAKNREDEIKNLTDSYKAIIALSN